MKKILSILLMLSLVVCLAACGEKDLPKEEENDLLDKVEKGDRVITKYFDEEMIDTYAKTQVIKLPENKTTGYEWVYVVDDSDVVKITKDEFQATENAGSLVGAGGYRVCEIEGVDEGDTIIYFNYIRGFETGEIPAESIKFYVSVNANNEVAITEEVH